MNATPERSTFRNGTLWNGTIAFPCERGLSLLPEKNNNQNELVSREKTADSCKRKKLILDPERKEIQ